MWDTFKLASLLTQTCITHIHTLYTYIHTQQRWDTFKLASLLKQTCLTHTHTYIHYIHTYSAEMRHFQARLTPHANMYNTHNTKIHKYIHINIHKYIHINTHTQQRWDTMKLSSLLNQTETYLSSHKQDVTDPQKSVKLIYDSRTAYLRQKLRLSEALRKEDKNMRTNMLVVGTYVCM